MKILFVCATNSIKSPIAEAFARLTFDSFTDIRSAGINPQAIHPMTVECLKESGITLNPKKPMSLSDLDSAFTTDLDYLVVLGLQDLDTSRIKSKNRVRWLLLDPTKAPPEEMRNEFSVLRDEIRDRVEDLVATVAS